MTRCDQRAFISKGSHPAAATSSSRCKFLHCYGTLMQPKLWMSKWIRHTLKKGKPACVQTADFALPSLSFFSPSPRRAHFFRVHAVFSITVKTAHWGRVVWVRALPCLSFPSVTCVVELLNPRSGTSIWKWLIESCLMENFRRKFRGQREAWIFASM